MESESNYEVDMISLGDGSAAIIPVRNTDMVEVSYRWSQISQDTVTVHKRDIPKFTHTRGSIEWIDEVQKFCKRTVIAHSESLR